MGLAPLNSPAQHNTRRAKQSPQASVVTSRAESPYRLHSLRLGVVPVPDVGTNSPVASPSPREFEGLFGMSSAELAASIVKEIELGTDERAQKAKLPLLIDEDGALVARSEDLANEVVPELMQEELVPYQKKEKRFTWMLAAGIVIGATLMGGIGAGLVTLHMRAKKSA